MNVGTHKRPLILGLSPYLGDTWRLSAEQVFELTGGNTGNLAFEYAVARQLNAPVLPLNAAPELIREQGDVVVLPLANQLGSHTDLGSVASILEKLDMPLLAIGLGAQTNDRFDHITLSAGTERWVRVLANHRPSSAPNIGVRGPFTLEVLDSIGLGDSAIVTGCPSNFINPNFDLARDVAEKIKAPIRRVAVTAGIPHVQGLDSVEQDLSDIVVATDGIYIVQHGLDMIRLGMAQFDKIAPASMELMRSYICPYLTIDEFRSWAVSYARSYSDARAWMDELRKFDFVVGTRFHGAMLAVQSGIPAGCITHDSRVEEMCETMGVPFLRHHDLKGGITRSRLKTLFPFDAKLYSAKRQILLNAYLEILGGAGLRSTWLQALCRT